MTDPRHIIFVESDQGLRDSVATLLEVNGFTVSVFVSGEDFLSAVLPERVDCIIISGELSDMKGLEALMAAKSRTAAPFVLTSSQANGDFAATALARGAWKILPMPFNGAEILEIIRLLQPDPADS